MDRIFLSHASEEHDLVVHIANYIEKNNLKAWYAPRDIAGGIDYDREIIEAIRDCVAFVLLLSHNSDASEDVKTEVYHAVKYKKQVICLNVDDVEPENLSYLLGMRHRLNWLERRDETLDKLIHDIKRVNGMNSDETAKPAQPAIKIPESKVKSETKIDPKPKSKPEPKIEPKPKLEPKPKPELKPKTSINVPKYEQKIKRQKNIAGFFWGLALIVLPILCIMPFIEYASTPNAKRVLLLAEGGLPGQIRAAAQKGADFTVTTKEIEDERNYTTLFLAVVYNTPEAVRAITETGVDLNAINTEKSYNVKATALMQAAATRDLDVVEVLIDAGANVNAQNDYGCTALMFAADDNKPEIVKFLLDHGANKNIRDKNGYTAYDYALEHKDFDSSVLKLLRPNSKKR